MIDPDTPQCYTDRLSFCTLVTSAHQLSPHRAIVAVIVTPTRLETATSDLAMPGFYSTEKR